MELNHITYQGPSMDDPELLAQVPESLAAILASVNGFIQFGGGLHIRGACTAPEWHCLRRAWHGPKSMSELFPEIDKSWVPFAEDCVGDQFLLKDREVLRLTAETGEVEHLGLTLGDFLRNAGANPIEYLSMEPLLQFMEDHGELPEGHLIQAYPPFCTKEAAQGVSLKAIPAWELHEFHSELARSLPKNDGDAFQIMIGD